MKWTREFKTQLERQKVNIILYVLLGGGTKTARRRSQRTNTGKYFGPNYIIQFKKLVETLCIYTSRVLFGGRDRRHSPQII
jgi:hypothetical protein